MNQKQRAAIERAAPVLDEYRAKLNSIREKMRDELHELGFSDREIVDFLSVAKEWEELASFYLVNAPAPGPTVEAQVALRKLKSS